MFTELSNYFFAAIILLSVIILIDLLLKFKRPLFLKTALILITFSIGWNSFAVIYCSHYGYNRWIVEIPRVLYATSGLNFFAAIYLHRVKHWVILFTSMVLFLQFFFLIYFSCIHPIDPHINTSEVAGFGNLKKAVNLLVISSILIIILNLYIKILKKYANDNIYFKKLRKWSFCVVIIITLIMFFNILSTFTKHLELLTLIIKGAAYLMTLLFILYRPSFINATNLQVSLSETFNFNRISKSSASEFLKYFQFELYFLNNDANIEEMADRIGTNAVLLQEHIKEKYEMNFIELVNKYRIDYFVSLVNTGQYANLTMDALAEKSGFNSRHNLYKSFKKFHGGSPSDLIKATAINL